MRAHIKQWGNSASVRIPASIMQACDLHLDCPVEVHVEDGRIVIEPVREDYDLDSLVAGIRDDNLHEELDTGAPVGREAY